MRACPISKGTAGWDASISAAYLFRSEIRRNILQTVGANRDEAVAAARQAQKDAETALELIAARERELGQRVRDWKQERGVYWGKGLPRQAGGRG
jgi:hypothetical protein